MELLDHVNFEDSILFSTVAAPIGIPTNRARGFLLLHTEGPLLPPGSLSWCGEEGWDSVLQCRWTAPTLPRAMREQLGESPCLSKSQFAHLRSGVATPQSNWVHELRQCSFSTLLSEGFQGLPPSLTFLVPYAKHMQSQDLTSLKSLVGMRVLGKELFCLRSPSSASYSPNFWKMPYSICLQA